MNIFISDKEGGRRLVDMSVPFNQRPSSSHDQKVRILSHNICLLISRMALRICMHRKGIKFYENLGFIYIGSCYFNGL